MGIDIYNGHGGIQKTDIFNCKFTRNTYLAIVEGCECQPREGAQLPGNWGLVTRDQIIK